MRKRSTLAAIGTAALALAAVTATADATPAPTGAVLSVPGAKAIPNSYIVVLKPAQATTASALTARYGGKALRTWHHALQGFELTASEAVAAKIAADPSVEFVQRNVEVHALATQSPTPSWGLDRIDQRNLPLNNAYNYDTTASNITAYIVDTGIRTTHVDFGGRATWGTNTTGDGIDTDCHGHGTHVAGTVGGATYGVAKGVHLVAVKVLDCAGSGTTAGVVAGVDWVTQNSPGPSVANMSLGGGAQPALDTAVANSIASGVTYAIASGNSNADACNFSPARVATALTVNASDINDNRASFSNFGTCTDLFAPGVNITSDWNTGDTATNTISGTSMATPHVTGAAALYLSSHTAAAPAEVHAAIVNNATPNVIINAGPGSPNRLLFTGASGGNPGRATLNRYRNLSTGDHASATSPPGGYALEGGIGTVNTSAAPGTHPIYQCLVGGRDFMTSLASNCEGTQFIGVIGFLYDSPPGPGNTPVRRCRIGSEHFDSPTSNCEGQIVEGILGYST
jgi:subtilisin family serine protease